MNRNPLRGWKPLGIVTVALVSAAAPCFGFADEVNDAKGRERIAASSYQLTVREDPLLPKGERPEASAPAGDGVLSVSIQPERQSFPANGPIAVTVTLRNAGERQSSLWSVETLGSALSMVFVHPKTGQQVRVKGPESPQKDAKIVMLEPGKSVQRTVVVQMPRVRPFPRPEPLPVPLPRLLEPKAAAPAIDRPQAIVAFPPREFPGLIGPMIPQGTVRVRLSLEFATPPHVRIANLYAGKIASETSDVEITAPQGQPADPVPGPPANREQAIKKAHPVAEAALTAAYNPMEPVRPARVGAWIADPIGSATVKDRDGGGWIISWTHTTKGKGHSHHVVIEVAPSGQATVREVFAGYSTR
mgnify:CR=1 FL=1